VLECRDAAGRGLRATFHWQRDRFAHTIAVIDPDLGLIPLLASREGHDQDRWPPSPPVQQTDVQRSADRSCVVLCVGMAGASHWSYTANSTTDHTALLFDVSCRVQQRPPWLGSQYQTRVEPIPDPDRGGSQWVLKTAGARCRLQFQPVPSFPPPTITSAVRDGVYHLVIAAPGSTLEFPQTIRWSYRIDLIS
jgi:hypothetical protein